MPVSVSGGKNARNAVLCGQIDVYTLVWHKLHLLTGKQVFAIINRHFRAEGETSMSNKEFYGFFAFFFLVCLIVLTLFPMPSF